MKKLLLFFTVVMLLASCTENYSNGERIGLVQKFSQQGIIWKSWEGELHITQTGMSSNTDFDFSIDNNKEPEGLVAQIDSAAQHGWLVKLTYHEVSGENITGSRGATNYFITKMELLNKNPLANAFGGTSNKQVSGIHDTIYVVIQREVKAN